MIKNIFARIWALWGLITFVITFILIFPFSMIAYLMPEVKGQTYFIAVSKIWMNIWLRLILCPVKISGLDNFKKGETYIVTFNHNALLDPPLSAPYIPGANKTIAKDSFAKVPIFGWFYKRGAVLINRNSEHSRRKSYDEMKKVLRKNMHICIYPEGTRNRTKEPLKKFHDGAFKLAVDAKKDIIPCVLKGTKEALPIDKAFYLLPTKLSMHFLPPVSSSNKTVEQLKNEVFEVMKQEYLIPKT